MYKAKRDNSFIFEAFGDVFGLTTLRGSWVFKNDIVSFTVQTDNLFKPEDNKSAVEYDCVKQADSLITIQVLLLIDSLPVPGASVYSHQLDTCFYSDTLGMVNYGKDYLQEDSLRIYFPLIQDSVFVLENNEGCNVKIFLALEPESSLISIPNRLIYDKGKLYILEPDSTKSESDFFIKNILRSFTK